MIKNNVALKISLLFCLLLLVGRITYTQSLFYVFLPWNLFLAWIPLVLSQKLAKHTSSYTLKFYGIYLLWLLFFPNCPYIITDLFHLHQRNNIAMWYDLILLISFAWNGLLLGYLSICNIHEAIRDRNGKFIALLLVLVSILLSGYGIYLGRYERWNSWDVVTNPFTLFHQIMNHIIHPFRNAKVILASFLFSAMLFVIYFSFRSITYKIQENDDQQKR